MADRPETGYLNDPGEATIWLGMDRLYGFHGHKARVIQGDEQIDTYSSHINFAGAGSSFVALEDMPLQQTASIPRLTGDYALTDHYTVGLSVGYAVTNNNAKLTSSADSSTSARPSQSTVLVSARGGYVRTLTPWLDLWLQAGVGIARQNALLPTSSGDRVWSLQTLNLSVEPKVVVKVLSNIGFLVNPYFEGSVAASLEQEDSQGVETLDYGEFSGGLTTGLVIWL